MGRHLLGEPRFGAAGSRIDTGLTLLGPKAVRAGILHTDVEGSGLRDYVSNNQIILCRLNIGLRNSGNDGKEICKTLQMTHKNHECLRG